jgi:4-hydroxybenzoate polyprenyltransferase
VPAALARRGPIRWRARSTSATVLLLAAVASTVPGPWAWAGVAVAAALLLWEHRLVRPGDLSRLDAAFFTMNGVISIAFFVCVLVGRVLPALGGR